MIRIRCYTEDRAFRMRITGHAGYDEIGKDIVCAAVSALVQTLAQYLGNTADLHYVDYDGAQIREIMADGREAMVAYETVMTGLRMIADQYPDNLLLTEGGL